MPHIGKTAVLKFDLKSFFPSIRSGRVYRLFCEQLHCSPDVSRILTRLTTLHGCVPQGSPTSTDIANLVIFDLTSRLKRMADSHDLNFTQFVDDGTFSGPAHIEHLRGTVERVIRQEGFRASKKPEKSTVLFARDEQIVTGVRVNKGIDAPSDKIRAITEELHRIERTGRKLSGKKQRSLRGKIYHVARLNKRVGKRLQSKFKLIILFLLILSF